MNSEFTLIIILSVIPILILVSYVEKLFFNKKYFGKYFYKTVKTCPVCLGDGRGEGWKTAWTCKACDGSGLYTYNEETLREERHNKAQSKLNL